MAVSIPTFPVGSSTTITLKSSAIDQNPYLGGPVQRVARLGDKWSYSVDMRPMQAGQARPFISRLLQGLSAKVLVPVIVSGVNLRGQTDVTVTNGAGKTLTFTGSPTGKTEGQFFSLVSNGVRYLHQITTVSGNTISFLPSLKVVLKGGEVLEFAQPMIEGFLEGSEQGFTVGMAENLGLSFKVNEAQ